MTKHNCIPLESRAEWTEALQELQHSFGHTWENCTAMQKTTGLKTYLYVYEANDTRIACPISEREYRGHTDIVTPYGFSGFIGTGDNTAFKSHWHDFVVERDYVCGYFGQNPVFENSSYFTQSDIFQYNELYVLDLSLDLDKLYGNLSTNRKRQLRDWENISTAIIVDDPELTEFLLENYTNFMRSKGASAGYFLTHETLSFLLDPALSNIHIAGVKEDGKVVAVSVFPYTTDMAEYLFNVALPEGRRHAATLLWHGVLFLKSRNVRYFNLGGGISENDSVAQFKQRFGCMEIPLRAVKQIYKPDIYKELCAYTNVDANDMIGYFPAYRRSKY